MAVHHVIKELIMLPERKEKLYPIKDVTLIPKFLSDEECQKIISLTESNDLEQLTTRKRLQFDSEDLAEWWWQRLQPHFNYFTQTDKYGNVWTAFRLNEHFRLAKYEVNDEFSKHEDGYYHPEYNVRSFTTAMIYLNTVPPENGGSTYFLEHGLRIHPLEGLCCVFVVDDLMHCGEKLRKGQKYLLRSDVMYRCDNLKQPEIHQQVFHLKRQAIDLEGKGQDAELKACKLWDDIFRLEGNLKRT
jgi:hypothetical protein